MTKKRELVDPKRLLEAVEEMADIANHETVNIALVGGFAMQVYGSDRFTKDIDVVTDSTTPLESLAVEGKLTFGGEQVIASNGIKVDVIRRNDDHEDLYDEALDKAEDVEDIPWMRVVTPEYLLAMKMQAARPKDDIDMTFLIEAEVVDLVLARKIIKKHLGSFAAEDLDRLVEEVEWQKSRKR